MSNRPNSFQGGSNSQRLVDAVIDGTATGEEIAELDRVLQSCPDVRRYYRDASELHASLRWIHRANESTDLFCSPPTPISLCNGDQAADERPLRAAAGGRHRGGTSAPARRARSGAAAWLGSHRFASAATLFGLLSTLGAAFLYSGLPRPENVPLTGRGAIVAELRSDDGCLWSHLENPLTVGSELRTGQRLTLEQGVARLWFQGGATVLVESPSTFELVSEKSLRLARGTVAVRASGPAKDFVVISPDASVLDLGTSFAVHCDETSATEVEVFEGAVEVLPESDPANRRLVGMGTNVSVGRRGDDVALFASPPEKNRFAPLLERLWQDIRVVAPPGAKDDKNASIVEAGFSDEPGPTAVDTFYGAQPSRGWLTPWVAAGNPTGEIRRDDPAFGLGDPCLQARFGDSYERAIAREYGPRGAFDPQEPHIITWRCRLEGDPQEFGTGYNDRVAFYGNPFFRRNSWPTNSWLVGVAGANEPSGRRKSSNEWLKRERGFKPETIEFASAPRRVFRKRWYFFNSREDGAAGAVFDRRNMVDTGMTLKFGVVYHFAVAVYPQERKYDAAIRDDERTVVRTGLYFRDRSATDANVFHATISADLPTDERGFTLDSVRVQPLNNLDIKRQLDIDGAVPDIGTR
jgi:hypothetical protein